MCEVMRVYTWVLMSEGLQIPRWEEYLPHGMTAIWFAGDKKAGNSLTVWAAQLGIVVHTVAKQPPDVLVAFWNGRPDFVDVAIATATVQTFVYLPNERGIGYALL